MMESNGIRLETATLGGGCFWCVEAVMQSLRGVEKVVSGYSGGGVADPSYREVSFGRTGHAEVVQVEFDPSVIDYADVISVFLTTHDPTTLNRQGADMGTQYRSVIFYHSEKQKEIAENLIAEFEKEGVYDDPIVTEVVPFEAFYTAENYHQNYFNDNQNQPYCQAVISPKLAKLRKLHQKLLKDA